MEATKLKNSKRRGGNAGEGKGKGSWLKKPVSGNQGRGRQNPS